MIIEVTIVCLTALTVAGMIFTHFERNRVKPSIVTPEELAALAASVEAQNAEIKKIEAKFTKASISQVFR